MPARYWSYEVDHHYLSHPNRNDLALWECKERLVSIDKSLVAVRGEVELEVDLCGTILVGHFMIAEIADDVVIGIRIGVRGRKVSEYQGCQSVVRCWRAEQW